MGAPSRAWARALAEHERAVDALAAELRSVPPRYWHRASRGGGWSPGLIADHVRRSYVLGLEATRGAPTMRLRVPPVTAWLSGKLMLPVLLALGRFPTGAESPEEVQPDHAVASRTAPDAAIATLRATAQEAAAALCAADPAQVRVTHAYFGSLSPRMALRLLSAHTQHHARQLDAHAYARLLRPAGPA
ncbi:MAG: DinB family protein [Gemmatimonadaceae bacterium]|jgi:hypothetical protein|nr:DinB family protein [Gemmatimonadaceae bacterium]